MATKLCLLLTTIAVFAMNSNNSYSLSNESNLMSDDNRKTATQTNTNNLQHNQEMSMLGGINGQDVAGQAEGHLTKDLIGEKLKAILGDIDWTYRNNLYPTLKGFENDTIAMVAASPVYLDDANTTDYDHHNNVRTDFTVNLENNVRWSRTSGQVAIVGKDGIIVRAGEDTLIASITGYSFDSTKSEWIQHDYKKIIPIKVKTANIPPTPEVFTLLLMPNPSTLSDGTVSGSGVYMGGGNVQIEAIAEECYKFINWTDEQGNVISDRATYIITITQDSVLYANFAKDSFDLEIGVNPAMGGGVTGALSGARVDCNGNVTLTANPNPGYIFLNWVDKQGNVISTGSTHTFTITKDTLLVANFVSKDISATKFTISVSNHKLISPLTRNHGIPIYITANADIESNITIDKLVVEIYKNIFYPRIADNCNTYTISRNAEVYEIILENIKVPKLVAGAETPLLTIYGDVLLGDRDSSAITIADDVKFSVELIEAPKLVEGYITLHICRAGGDRLLTSFDLPPSIVVKNNPAVNTLFVGCEVIEIGNYTLEIVDMSGQVMLVKKFEANPKVQTSYNFEIPLRTYDNGAYIIVMTSPTALRYSTKFILEK